METWKRLQVSCNSFVVGIFASLFDSFENVLAVGSSVHERTHGCHRDQSSRETRGF